MAEQNEIITIDGKALHFGVLCSDAGDYQCYTYPGMGLEELAFCIMVTERLLIKGGKIKDRKEFEDLVTKFYDDPQYQPVEKAEPEEEKESKDGKLDG